MGNQNREVFGLEEREALMFISVCFSDRIIRVMYSQKVFRMESFYEEILRQFQHTIETKAKHGMLAPSIPDLLMSRIRYLLSHREELFRGKGEMEGKCEVKVEHKEEKEDKNTLANESEDEEKEKGSLRVEEKMEEIKEEIEEIEDEFQFFERDEKKGVKNEIKVQLFPPAPQKKQPPNPRIKQQLKQQEQQCEQNEFIQEYMKEQELREKILSAMQCSCQSTIIGITDHNSNKVKRYAKTKANDVVILLNLSHIYVRQNTFPFKQSLYTLKGLVNLSYDHKIFRMFQEMIKEGIKKKAEQKIKEERGPIYL